MITSEETCILGCGANEVRDDTTNECQCPGATHDKLSTGACVDKCPSGQERVGDECLPECGTNKVRDATTNECQCADGYMVRLQCPMVPTDDSNPLWIDGYQLCDAVVDAVLVQSCKDYCVSDANCKGFTLQHRDWDSGTSALIAGTQHCHFWGTECTGNFEYMMPLYHSYTKAASGYDDSAGICASYEDEPQDMQWLMEGDHKKEIQGDPMITSEETCILGCTACVDKCTTAAHAVVLKKMHAELFACDSDVSVSDSSETCTTPCMRERCKDADKDLISNKYKEIVVKKETC